MLWGKGARPDAVLGDAEALAEATWLFRRRLRRYFRPADGRRRHEMPVAMVHPSGIGESPQCRRAWLSVGVWLTAGPGPGERTRMDGEQLPVEVSVATLRQQADRLEGTRSAAACQLVAPIPPRLIASLFVSTSRPRNGRPACRRLKLPLASSAGETLRDEERLQVTGWKPLQQELAPSDSQVSDGYRPPDADCTDRADENTRVAPSSADAAPHGRRCCVSRSPAPALTPMISICSMSPGGRRRASPRRSW